MEDFKLALKAYYEMMGWDEHGIPTDIKIRELELEWIGA